MKKTTLSRAVLIASALMLAPLGTQAQSAAAVPDPVSAAPAPATSFDMNRVFVVTAGVIGGAIVAGAVTGGAIIPLYCWATGSTAGAGMGMGMGAAAMENGAGLWALRSTMATLGAVGGGFYADAVYQNQ
ncbi:MAG TPA: hypothetical protein DCS21_12460 [Gammaproteobacteria bacterium]|nr:hypothetical protein [Gammaproteobacteria bacterium]